MKDTENGVFLPFVSDVSSSVYCERVINGRPTSRRVLCSRVSPVYGIRPLFHISVDAFSSSTGVASWKIGPQLEDLRISLLALLLDPRLFRR